MSKKQIVYISGPMTGQDEQECRQRFAEAQALLEASGYTAFDPWDLHDLIPWANYHQILQVDLEILHGCDAIYLLKGWQDSNGCKKEHLRAEWNDLIVMEEE